MAAKGRPGFSPRQRVAQLVRDEVARLGRSDLEIVFCFSDASWRRVMAALDCPVYVSRLASPTARRGTRGKLGMATVCHLRHGHPAVVYVKTRGRPWPEVAETGRHEALHLARPSYGHRKIAAALRQGLSSGLLRKQASPGR